MWWFFLALQTWPTLYIVCIHRADTNMVSLQQHRSFKVESTTVYMHNNIVLYTTKTLQRGSQTIYNANSIHGNARAWTAMRWGLHKRAARGGEGSAQSMCSIIIAIRTNTQIYMLCQSALDLASISVLQLKLLVYTQLEKLAFPDTKNQSDADQTRSPEPNRSGQPCIGNNSYNGSVWSSRNHHLIRRTTKKEYKVLQFVLILSTRSNAFN